jgi:hypothetical protein
VPTFAFLAGRVRPRALTDALERDLIFAAPGTILRFREGDEVASIEALRARGALHLLYRIAVSGEITAEDGLDEGWIDAIVADEAACRELLSRADLSPRARDAALRLLRFPSRRAALALERAEFALIQASSDKEEGIRAFFERRPPAFHPEEGPAPRKIEP